MNTKNKFGKKERLSSHSLIQKLVEKGKSFKVFPFYVKWTYVDINVAPVQVTFSVSKKKYKRAVDRNLIKRKCKEAYRLQKNPLIEKINGQNKNIIIIISYINKEIVEYEKIEKAIEKIISTLIENN